MSDSEKDPEKAADDAVTSDEESKKEIEESSESESASNRSDDPSEGDASKDDSSGEADDDEADEADDDDDDDDDDDEGSEESATASSTNEKSGSSAASLLIGALALAAGFGIGWFGHDYQAKKEVQKADAAVEGEGEAARGPCKDWENSLCDALGKTSFACNQAKMASSLLSGSACAQASLSVPATIEGIKAERTKCTELETNLCQALGAESKACELVKSQTPSFPPERCDQMMQNYDQVLAQLKMMEERGAIPGAGGPPGHPGAGGPPHGVARPAPPAPAPPAAAPPAATPPAATP